MSRGFPSCWAETCSSLSENFLIPWRPFLLQTWAPHYANCIRLPKMNIQHIGSQRKLEFPISPLEKVYSDKDHFLEMPYLKWSQFHWFDVRALIFVSSSPPVISEMPKSDQMQFLPSPLVLILRMILPCLPALQRK